MPLLGFEEPETSDAWMLGAGWPSVCKEPKECNESTEGLCCGP